MPRNELVTLCHGRCWLIRQQDKQSSPSSTCAPSRTPTDSALRLAETVQQMTLLSGRKRDSACLTGKASTQSSGLEALPLA